MIIGFGSDLCSIERIQKSLDRFGQRFIDRVFTPVEQAKANRRELTRAGTYAKRFAAKEACSKALGHGFRAGVFLVRKRAVEGQRVAVLVVPGGRRIHKKKN